ncbi:MAG: fused protease/ribonucleoside-triphosphate reductase [Bradymonadaceae bacterium]
MVIDIDRHGTFQLQPAFLADYRDQAPPWGFGALSWVTFKRTYSRDGEAWWETCRRVIEGMFTVQKVHCLERGLPWNEAKARGFARRAYDRLFHFKWTPPGRGLWMMGADYMYDRGGAALNNCGFISTRDIDDDFGEPFGWMLHMSMLGVGVGFDTRGRGTCRIEEPARRDDEAHLVGDSRQGWAEAVERLLNAYVGEAALPGRWDFSEVRPRGTKLESFGGFASGPAPLKRLLESLEARYEAHVGRRVDAELITDTMNLIGRCVIAGGTRRSAQIALGAADDEQFLGLKEDDEKVEAFRWASNNSVFAHQGMDYTTVARRTTHNGEPGYFWLENARAYGRMAEDPGWEDEQAMGTNPCGEQTLWDRELCCLVETYPAHHDSLEDYLQTLKIAYQYAKTVTLVPTHDQKTNAIMLRNRRIGCSMSGIVQAINRHGYAEFFDWCDAAYGFVQSLDRKYSNWLCVPRSIKTTSVKPSGTVSLLAGASPGVHWPHAPYFLRRMRIDADNPLWERCKEAGYPVEPDVYSDDTMVVSFPVHVEGVERTKADVPLREKVDLAAQVQHYWSDNQVSCTAEFDPELEGEQLHRILEAYEDRLKAVSFLPRSGHGYEQPPYETIGRTEYERLTDRLEPIEGHPQFDAPPLFCSGSCDG